MSRQSLLFVGGGLLVTVLIAMLVVSFAGDADNELDLGGSAGVEDDEGRDVRRGQPEARSPDVTPEPETAPGETDTPGTPAPRLGQLDGVVTDASLAPVAGAVVELLDGDDVTVMELPGQLATAFAPPTLAASARTDASGRYAVGIRPGRYRVVVRAQGYGVLRRGGITVNPPPAPSRADFSLPRAHDLHGRVTGPGGVAMKEIPISVVPDLGTIAFAGLGGGDRTTSREDGRFSVTGLTLGRKTIVVDLGEGRYAYRRGIEVPTTEEVAVAIRQGASVFGRVRREDGPVAGLRLTFAGSSSVVTVTTDGQGAYRTGALEEGPYTILFDAAPLTLASPARRAVAIEGTAPVQHDLDLVAGAVLSGVVVARDDQKPIEGALVTFRGTDLRTRTAPDGTFRLAGVPLTVASNLKLRVEAEGFTWLPSGKKAEQLAAGQKVGGIRVEMDRSAIVRGRVLDPNGQGVPGARVTIVQNPAHARFGMDKVTTDVDGRYELPVGTTAKLVKLRATHPAHAAGGAVIKGLRPGQAVIERDIQLLQTGEVTGVVRDPSGRALEGVVVRAHPKDRRLGAVDSVTAERLGQRAVTDAQGRFRMILPTTELTVRAASTGWVAVSGDGQACRPAPGRPVQLEPIVVAAKKRLEARIVDAAGKPLTGVVAMFFRKSPDGLEWRKIVAMDKGRYKAVVPDGTYDIYVIATDGMSQDLGRLQARFHDVFDRGPALKGVAAGSTDVVVVVR